MPTPYSGTDRMSGVEFHAAAADTILKGSYITEVKGIAQTRFIGAIQVRGREQTVDMYEVKEHDSVGPGQVL